jgi:hypothetical protein
VPSSPGISTNPRLAQDTCYVDARLVEPPVNSTQIGKVTAAVDADAARLIEIFKDLHQNPELGFTVTEGIAKTGLVPRRHGRQCGARGGVRPTSWPC